MKFISKLYLTLLLNISIYAHNTSDMIIVMDISGSMYGKIGHNLKISEARTAVKTLLLVLDKNSSIGLETMGGDKNKGCKNFKLALPLKEHNHQKILSFIKKVKPKGKTPLASALQEAYENIKDTKNPTITLVSDGEERCGNNACNIAKKLKKSNDKLKINILSLATNQTERDKLLCLADSTDGTYTKIYQEKYSHENALSNSNSHPQTSQASKIKIFSSSLMDDIDATVVHKVYTIDGLLVLDCISTPKDECTKPIDAGKYTVSSSYKNQIRETKIFVMKNANAYIYTNFKSNNQSPEEVYTQAENTDTPSTDEDTMTEEAIIAREMQIGQERSVFNQRRRMSDLDMDEEQRTRQNQMARRDFLRSVKKDRHRKPMPNRGYNNNPDENPAFR